MDITENSFLEIARKLDLQKDTVTGIYSTENTFKNFITKLDIPIVNEPSMAMFTGIPVHARNWMPENRIILMKKYGNPVVIIMAEEESYVRCFTLDWNR